MGPEPVARTEAAHVRRLTVLASAFWVSPAGNDRASGATAATPFRTIARAATAAAAASAASRTAQNITVNLLSGVYRGPIVLGPEHSGSASAPIHFRAATGHRVAISGGCEVNASAATLAGGIYSISLPAHCDAPPGSFGSLAPSATLGECAHNKAEAFFNGAPLELARYPNANASSGLSTFMRVAAGSPPWGAQWFAIDPSQPHAPDVARARRWDAEARAPGGALWFHGWWAWDWADSYVRATAVAANATGVVAAVDNATLPLYNYEAGGRVILVNARSELDAPGEYHIAPNGTLAFLPPRALRPGDTLTVSLTDAAACLLCVRPGAAHLAFEDLEVGYTRGAAVAAAGVRAVVLANVTVRNSGRAGVELHGEGNALRASRITGVGCAALNVSGGDARTLAPSGVVVEGNSLSGFARLVRTYQPGIAWAGVGLLVRGNTLRGAPHAALLGGGVASAFESNLVEDAAFEVSDAGAFYSGRRWDQRGNVLRANVFRRVRSRVPLKQWPPGGNVMGVYLDDQMSGYALLNNSFDDVQTGIFLGGGRRNRLVGNAFSRTDACVHVDARGEGCFNWTCFPDCPGGFCSHAAQIWQWIEGPGALPLAQPPWLLRFPSLSSLRQEWPGLPVFNEVVHNRYDAATTKAFFDGEALGADELKASYFSTVENNTAA